MEQSVVRRSGPAVVLLALLVLAPAAMGQDLAEFEKRLTKFTLDNGLTFLVLERHEVPVVSFHTYADVGAVDEVKGITGMAHLFEHMAFKGTQTIGTKDYQAEAAAMAKLDELFDGHQEGETQGRPGGPGDPQEAPGAVRPGRGRRPRSTSSTTSTRRRSPSRGRMASTPTPARTRRSTSSVCLRTSWSSG